MGIRSRQKLYRKDANHDEIVAAFLALGCSVADLAERGDDIPDLLVGIAGVDVLVEVKTASGELEPGQARFARDWRGRKPEVARTPDDALRIVNAVRQSLRPRR